MRAIIVISILLAAGCGDDSRVAKLQAENDDMRKQVASATRDLESANARIKELDALVPPAAKAKANAKTLLGDLLYRKVFTKIERPAKFPVAWIGPGWEKHTYESKQLLVGIVYGYYYGHGDRSGTVILREPMNGKVIGKLTPTAGEIGYVLEIY